MIGVRSAICVGLVFLLTSVCQTSAAQRQAEGAEALRLAALFTDNMVLQQGQPNAIWGWAEPGQQVRVRVRPDASFAPVEPGARVPLGSRRASAVAGPDGRWKTELGPLPAGGPYTVQVRGGGEATLENVLVGEVWLASGQSNMQWPVYVNGIGAMNGPEEIAAADYPHIRLFTVPRRTAFVPQNDVDAGAWQECSPETVPGFSAVAYFFGRALHQETGLPIGLIHSSWGGTPAESWTSADTLGQLPDFAAKVAELTGDRGSIEAQLAAYEQALVEWEAAFDQEDPGYDGGVASWAAPDFDDSAWQQMDLPTIWEAAGEPDYDGTMWFRREFELIAAHADQPFVLSLGPVNDYDRTFLNGVEIGRHEGGDQAAVERVYQVAAEHVRAGRNVLTVRVHDIGNVGGFQGRADQMFLEAGEGAPRLALNGPWRYHRGLDERDLPPKPEEPLGRPDSPHVPTVLYNAMIAPVVPYGMQGVIWYQGESNASRAQQYRTLFPALIQDWRQHWDQGDFPFLFVQLANFQEVKEEPGDDQWAELREAQLMTLALPKTGMASAIDIGEADDIHPANKQEVGRRLALAARHIAYGEDLVYSGPIYRESAVEDGAMRMHFDHVGGGLHARDGETLTGFAIAGEDRQWVWADAQIDGETVVVSSPEVPAPVAVRYAWAINPVANLTNREGLPASPFRTDDWPGITE